MATEKRLIDANTLIKQLEFLAKFEYRWKQSVILGVVHTVQQRPTVDAVEVIRCKECKYFWHYKRTQMHVDGNSVPAGMCHLWSKIDSEYPVLPDDFCSHGKKG